MKRPITFAFVAASALLNNFALAQVDPGLLPTASFGCEPHEDDWHCDGPKTSSITLAASVTSPPVAVITTTTHAEDDHAAGTGTLPPSRTESLGCEPHGDHWHCNVPTATTGASSVTIAPSPTESVGCESHGDHWHCDGPAVTPSSSAGSLVSVSTNRTVVSPSSTQSPLAPSSGATLHGVGYGFFAAFSILAVSMSL
ncbi:hypothetical protein WAI453_002042 [Rhynchosporium graminicola]